MDQMTVTADAVPTANDAIARLRDIARHYETMPPHEDVEAIGAHYGIGPLVTYAVIASVVMGGAR